MYKVTNGLSVDFIMSNLGNQRSTRSSCNVTMTKDEKEKTTCSNKSNVRLPRVKKVKFGLHSFRSLGPRLWRLVPDELRAIKSLNVFKEKI